MSKTTLTADDVYIQEQLRRFKMVDIREKYTEIIDDAIQAKLGYKDFLIRLLQSEEKGKSQRLAQRMLLTANFDFIKTIDEIEYAFNESINYQKVRELGTLSFMSQSENIIIIGPPGVGKSMIATAPASTPYDFLETEEAGTSHHPSVRQGRSPATGSPN